MDEIEKMLNELGMSAGGELKKFDDADHVDWVRAFVREMRQCSRFIISKDAKCASRVTVKQASEDFNIAAVKAVAAIAKWIGAKG